MVDDDPAMVALARSLLTAAGWPDIRTAGTGAAALAAADAADVILLDHQLPDTTGLELLTRLLARPVPPSVILMTGAGSDQLVAAAMRLGAEDYLAKDGRLRELLPELVERARRNRLLRETRTAVERDLVRAERLAAIGEMTVTLHHEINNPLMAALAETDLLLAATGLEARARDGLGSIKEALIRVREILKKAGDLRRADSTAYLSRLGMIDLAGRVDPPVALRGRAVLRAHDEELGRVASLLLRHAGFTVERVRSVREAETEARQPGTTLVVLTLAGDGSAALDGYQAPPERPYAVVALVQPGPASTEALAEGADLVLTLPFDPATFTTQVLGTMR